MGVPMWLLGVSLSFGGCVLSNFGINLQKYAHNIRNAIPAELRKSSVYMDKFWIMGITSVIIGSLADLLSFGFAAMSLLAPLGAMTLVVNIFFASCFLGEKLTKHDIISTGIIFLGTVLSIIFGSKGEEKYELEELIEMYSEPLFIGYAIFFVAFVLAAVLLLYIIKTKKRMGTITPCDKRAEQLTYPILAGTFGAHSVLFAKSFNELAKKTIQGKNQFYFMGTYVLLFFLGFFLFLQIRTLNEGLKRADALLIVPVYQVCWVTMTICVGMTYFKDYKRMDIYSLPLFFFGLLLIIIGVRVLFMKPPNENEGKLVSEIAKVIQESDEFLNDVLLNFESPRSEWAEDGNNKSSRNILETVKPAKLDYEDDEEDAHDDILLSVRSSIIADDKDKSKYNTLN